MVHRLGVAIMRLAFSALCLLVLLAVPPALAATSSDIKGLWLITDYPGLTARAGDSQTIKLKLQNENLPPQRAALSVTDVPQGWKATFLGNGEPIAAAMAATNESVGLQLRIDVPQGVSSGSQTLTLHAKSAEGEADLPLQVAIGDVLPARLEVKAKLPSLRGTPKSSFEYQFTVTNQSGQDLVVRLAADGPKGFQSTFTEGYGSQEISSIPIDAGQSKDLKVKVQPPGDVAAGDYPVTVNVATEGASAQTPLLLQITGQPKLRLTGQDGRLSGEAEAGKATPLSLIVSNEGSAPADDVDLSATPPSGWEVEFEPKQIAALAPNEKRTIQALITPSGKALAGDYMTTLRAAGKGDSSSADFRISVTTSTLWGIVGAGIIAIALLIAVGAVARFGRR
jgi:uncharacterized membrane protein